VGRGLIVLEKRKLMCTVCEKEKKTGDGGAGERVELEK